MSSDGPDFSPPSANKYCGSCGNPLVATAAVCTKCGTPAGSPKSKGLAIILAVFLAPWTWLYTYKRDSTKFWIGIVGSVVLAFVPVIGWIIALVFIRLWAIIDVAMKPDSYYQNFPN